MKLMKQFIQTIQGIGWGESENDNLLRARKIVSELNRFLFARKVQPDMVDVLEQQLPYFSDFHKFWHLHHEEILGLSIDWATCERIADKLHEICVQTGGQAFSDIYDTGDLPLRDVCKIRMLTANQDFRGSRSFADFAKIYEDDPTIFDIDKIISNPEEFLAALGITRLSQSDKRVQYAGKFAAFVKEHGGEPIRLAEYFGNDMFALRKAMISCEGAGYGNKKADMVIRDMVVHGVWNNVSGFDKIDVASDVNTIGVALRTGLLRSEIPLVSSFLDIFCYQYGHVDEKNAMAWREVWKTWMKKYPEDEISSPCLLDYFIYGVIGRQFCRKTLAIFKCEHGHIFKWHSGQNKTCQVCFADGKKHEKAALITKVLPCTDDDGSIAICKTDYVKSGRAPEGLKQCPFKDICGDFGKHNLQPPKSISIFGQTGWNTAYSIEGDGGGGLMA
jgi:hypothetical protein